MNDLAAAIDVGWDGELREPVRQTVLSAHVELGRMLDNASTLAPDAGHQHRRQLADAFSAGACTHLVAVQEAMLPIVRQRVPNGRGMIADYVAHVRELELALHRLKARLYGEAHASRQPHRTPWPRLREWLIEHDERESLLLDSILSTMTAAEAPVLARRMTQIADHAPTRPHPHAPHTGLAGRASHRILGVADGFWDSAEGRSVPRPARSQTRAHNSLLTSYLLGVPTFDPAETRLTGEPGKQAS